MPGDIRDYLAAGPGDLIEGPTEAEVPAKWQEIIRQRGAALEKGTKHDKGKAPLHLVPPEFVVSVARVLEFGAGKYGEYNWQSGLRLSRIYDSALRHLFSWWNLEENDPESGLPHVWHAACNLMFLTWFMEHRKDLDDRPKHAEQSVGTGPANWTDGVSGP